MSVAGGKSKVSTRDAQAGKQSKKDVILELLRRKEGATIGDLTKATNWQNHSVRGFLSGVVWKKMGLTLASEKNEAGERIYRIAH